MRIDPAGWPFVTGPLVPAAALVAAAGPSGRRGLRLAALVAAGVVGLMALLYGVDLLLSRGDVPRGTAVAGVDLDIAALPAVRPERRGHSEASHAGSVPEIVGFVVSPAHAYEGRPGDGPLDVVTTTPERITVRAGHGIVGDRYAGRAAHRAAAVTVLAVEGLEDVADELVGCLSTRSGPVVLSPGLCVARSRVHVIALVISSEHGSSSHHAGICVSRPA